MHLIGIGFHIRPVDSHERSDTSSDMGSSGRRAEKNKDNKDKDRVSRLRFYGDKFVLDTVSGSFYRLTPTAGFILKALIDGKDHDQLAEIVENRFGTNRSSATRDVELFLSELRSLEIIENPWH